MRIRWSGLLPRPRATQTLFGSGLPLSVDDGDRGGSEFGIDPIEPTPSSLDGQRAVGVALAGCRLSEFELDRVFRLVFCQVTNQVRFSLGPLFTGGGATIVPYSVEFKHCI